MSTLKTKIASRPVGPYEVWYRPGTTDERVLTEVVEKKVYRRSTLGFDVEQGEHWLDLGANIGAFAVYCKLRGATAACYEPDPDCFQLLTLNVQEFKCVRAAVTSLPSPAVRFFQPKDEGNHTRGSIINVRRFDEVDRVPNVQACRFTKHYDGIKMDIEGSEFGIIDEEMIPSCRKLVMEYHSSRDPSIQNLKRRLDVLRSKFEHVQYPPEFDRKMESSAGTGGVKTFFDRFVFCWNDK